MPMASDALYFLTAAPSREVAEQELHPSLPAWFHSTLGMPTPAQRCAWPTIFDGQHLLLSAPTGSGKTLAAFLPIVSELVAKSGPLRGSARQAAGLQCLYVAPLKALCRDVRVNLKQTWR